MEQKNSELIKALVKANKKFPELTKNESVDYKTRDGRIMKYSYTDLSTIMNSIRFPLADVGIIISHRIDLSEIGESLVTSILHESGECLESRQILTNGLTPQARGSELTYFRRYAVCCLLGLASKDDDDDGASASEEKNKVTQKKSNPEPTQNGKYKTGKGELEKALKKIDISQPIKTISDTLKEIEDFYCNLILDGNYNAEQSSNGISSIKEKIRKFIDDNGLLELVITEPPQKTEQIIEEAF